MPLGVGFAVTREWGFLFISISWECCKRGVSVLGLFYAHMALWHVLLCLFSGGMYDTCFIHLWRVLVGQEDVPFMSRISLWPSGSLARWDGACLALPTLATVCL